jgi:hypothetical protein
MCEGETELFVEGFLLFIEPMIHEARDRDGLMSVLMSRVGI